MIQIENATCHPLRNFALLLCFALLLNACAELDQLTKPRVEGLRIDSQFNEEVLASAGVGEVHVESNLTGDSTINIDALETLLIAAIREKRRDISVSQTGRYEVEANLIADDVSRRTDNFDEHTYKWAKRTVKVSYVVADSSDARPVWSGIIETSREELASYESQKSKKTADKVLDVIIAALDEDATYPYPTPPPFTDVMKLNFEGFALNLPTKNK